MPNTGQQKTTVLWPSRSFFVPQIWKCLYCICTVYLYIKLTRLELDRTGGMEPRQLWWQKYTQSWDRGGERERGRGRVRKREGEGDRGGGERKRKEDIVSYRHGTEVQAHTVFRQSPWRMTIKIPRKTIGILRTTLRLPRKTIGILRTTLRLPRKTICFLRTTIRIPRKTIAS